jgi:deoxyribose-phosphate aldolase
MRTQEPELRGRIQYTNVRAETTREEIREHCEIAARHCFQAVMVQPCWVLMARDILRGSGVRIATAVAYPMGGETAVMKVALVREVVRLGADEVDFQPNIGYLRSGLWNEFTNEIRMVVEAAGGLPAKAMCEFGFLDERQRILCLTLAEDAGVAYVKNSSGVGPGGSPATPEDVRFMKAHLHGQARVKASGGIRTRAQALALFEAGADLIGTSAGPAILGVSGPLSAGY